MNRFVASALLLVVAVQLPAQTGAGNSGDILTLDAAFRRALAENAGVSRARTEVEAAEAQKDVIFSAILPRIHFSGSGIYNSEEVSFGEGSDQRSLLPQQDWNYRVTLNQPIYAGNRERRAYDQAKLAILNAREGVRSTEDQTLLRVAADYLGVVTGDALVDVERRNLQLANARLKQSRSFYEAGEVTRVDVLRADAAVAGAQRRLAAAEQLRETAAGRLRIDLDLEGPMTVASPNIAGEGLPDENALIESALARRPEIGQARNNVRIADLEVRKQRGAYLPVVTADAAYIQQKSMFPTDSYSQAAIRVSVPIFTSGETAARVEFAKKRELQAKESLDELEQIVREDVRKALIDLKAAETNRVLAAEQLKAAEAEYEQIFELYRAQEASSLDLQSAESALTEARRAAVTTTLDRDLARLRVWFSAGTLKNEVLTEVTQ